MSGAFGHAALVGSLSPGLTKSLEVSVMGHLPLTDEH
jgi:hypothetical protein